VKTLPLILMLASVPCIAQTPVVPVPDAKAEALVSCAQDSVPTLTPYGLAKAMLSSLWYARNAGDRGTQIKQAASENDSEIAYRTALMRIVKMGTNDFICAKRAINPFSMKANDENTRTVAHFMMMTYDQHISINQRMLQIVKTLNYNDMTGFMDQISTLQVERDQRWADLVKPTGLSLMLLVDQKRIDKNGKSKWLIITKAQKETLLKWATENFPEFNNGTPQEKWSDPAKTAQMYFMFLEQWKCSDEL
jgi:hypothetical protein